MGLIKKIVTYFIVISMIITSSSFSYAASNSYDRNDKADVLNSISILRGNGNGYNLDSQLKRSEAATFIVRLIGEEEKVIRNKSAYSDTSFTDVDTNDWFAPYVGYCSEMGIINGYGDKTFKPNDYVSEKAFLKMVLTALGYEYNADFTWSDVYNSAYSVGVVKDDIYKTKVEDNTNLTRGNVVDVLYEALRTDSKDNSIRMIQTFIDTLIISKDKAIEYGLVEDDVETLVEKVSSIDSNTIEITFNEAIECVTSDNILIYETKNVSSVLNVINILGSEDNFKYTITLDQEQKVDEDYSIRVSGVADYYGNKSQGFTVNFLGYRPDEIKSDYFKISKVEPISNNLIYLYFTQPVNDNVLQPSYYSLNKSDDTIVSNFNMQISKLTSCDNGISIYFKDFSFKSEEFFEINISGNITSQYGVQLNDGEGDSVKFKASIQENEALNLEEIVTLNANTLQLVFNKTINPIIAEQVFSYYITSSNGIPIQILDSVVTDDGNAVRLSVLTNFIEGYKYNIMINNINDVSRQFYITEKAYEFKADFSKSTSMKIKTIYSLDANTVVFYVDRPLDYESATTPSNYRLYGVTKTSYTVLPSAVYYHEEGDDNIVKIYLPADKKLESINKYELKIMTSLKDDMGNRPKSIETYPFSHNNSKEIESYITEAKIVGANTIKLTFNKEIALDIPNVLNTNYSISYIENGNTYLKTPIGVNYINPTTIILKFDQLDVETGYLVSFDKLVDYANIETANTNGKYSMEVILGK